VVPVGFPLIGVKQGTEVGYGVDAAYAPAGTGLLQAAANIPPKRVAESRWPTTPGLTRSGPVASTPWILLVFSHVVAIGSLFAKEQPTTLLKSIHGMVNVLVNVENLLQAGDLEYLADVGRNVA
jgi:hypothetical protein